MFSIVTLLWATAAGGALAQVQSDAQRPVMLHAGSGTGELSLTNKGRTAMPLKISTGPFEDAASQSALPTARAAFTLEASGGKLPARLAPGQVLQVAADLSQAAGASMVRARLYNLGVAMGELRAIAADAPMNLSIEGAGSAETPLTFSGSSDAALTLKNGDAEAYALSWSFQLGCRHQAGNVLLPPNGSALIHITPEDCLYTWKDAIRPSAQTGSLHLALLAPGGVPAELLPQQTLAVHLSLMRGGPDRTLIHSYLYVAGALLLGGLLSLLASSLLPTLLRKTALRSQINELADRTSSISTMVDSNLRVLLRLERKKLEMLLGKARAVFLTTADTLDLVAAAIERLDRRLDIAERLDELRRRLDAVSATAPPSVTDGLDAQLQSAANQLHAFNLPEANLAAATVLLDQAQGTLALLDDGPSMAKLIASSFTALKTRVAMFPQPQLLALQQALPGIFDILVKPFDDPVNITHEMLFAIDHAISSMHTAFDYAVVKARTPLGLATAPGATRESCKQRLVRHEHTLFNLLGTLSWQALRDARTLVNEMREDIYEEDVLAEFTRKGQARIVFDTQKARPYLPVYFSVEFKDRRLDRAAATGRLLFRWTFPGPLHEAGLKVCHFFPENQPRKAVHHAVSVSLEASGQQLAAEADQPLHTITRAVEVEAPRGRDRSRLFTETLRFFIAFGIALAGLLSGALEQLSKLDMVPATVAIVALGFGADSIKNLLTQAPRSTST